MNSVSKIETGFNADKLLKKLIEDKSVEESDIFSMKLGVRDFVCAMVKKIIEKSPIKFSIVCRGTDFEKFLGGEGQTAIVITYIYVCVCMYVYICIHIPVYVYKKTFYLINN